MTQKEYKKCTELMNDAIIHAKRSIEYYTEAEQEKTFTEVQKHVKELQGQNALGYAEGINQALAVIGFKHEKMEVLSKLI